MVYWVVVRNAGRRTAPPATRLGPFESMVKAQAAARAHGRRTESRGGSRRQRVEIVLDYG
jgi:hypothetical protein